MKVYIIKRTPIILPFLLFVMPPKVPPKVPSEDNNSGLYVVKKPGTAQIVDDFLNRILADAAAVAASTRTTPHN
jgi:hypothetical protein